MKLKLMFCEEFTNNFKGTDYNISTFIDPQSLTIIYGSNVKSEKPFIKGELYDCEVIVKNNKLKVTKVL